MTHARRWVAVLGLFLGVAGLPAAEPAKASVWKIEGKTCTVYLAGSVHLLKPGDYPLPDAFGRAYADAKTVYFEILLEEMSKPQVQEQFLKLGTYPHGETIQKDLSPGTYQKLADFVAGRQVLPMAVLQRMRPWMAAMTISITEIQALGAQADKGVDHYFNAKARAEAKTRKQLETAEMQMNLFGKLSREEQEAMLVETLDSLKIIEGEFDKMIRAWREGDTSGLEELFLAPMKQHPKLIEVLLYERNRNWIPEIEKVLAGSENTMIIVGVGHLAGENSVIDLLRKAGHTIVQQ